MKRMDRRTFMLVASVGGTSAVLVACGNDPGGEELNPTMIPVEGAPPTLAPNATPGGGAADGGDTPADGGGAAEGVVVLEAQDPFNWSTNELEAAPGATIQITNTGLSEHDFNIDELGINEPLPNGESVDVTLADDLAVGDTYTYYCSIPGHRESGMEGTLTIVEASAAAPAAEEASEGDSAAGAASDGPVILEAQDPFNWSTKELEAAPGATIQVTNTGVMEHDFVIDELGINEPLPSGETVDVALAGDLAVGDTYTFYCSIPGHRESGMEGTLTIVEASAPAPAAAEEVTEGEEVGGTTPAGPVILEAQDPFNWSTKELEAAPGATIQVTNTGVMEHDFVIDELGINEPLPSGETVDVTLADDLAVGDTYTFYCSIPGHRESGMEGTLAIVEASAPAPAAAEEEATPAEHEMEAAATPEGEEAAAEGVALPAETLALMDDPAVVALEATDPYNWSLKAIDVAPGQIIRVLNRGNLEHNFVVDEWDVSQPLTFGEPVDVQVPSDVAIGDTFEYYCSTTGHREAGMVGIATIVEGDEAATPSASPAASPVAGAVVGGSSEIALSAVDLAFEPKEFSIPANTDVVVTITNNGALEHDFVIDDLNIHSASVFAGESVTVTINAAAGTHEFHCSLPGHAQAGMVGTITIQ